MIPQPWFTPNLLRRWGFAQPGDVELARERQRLEADAIQAREDFGRKLHEMEVRYGLESRAKTEAFEQQRLMKRWDAEQQAGRDQAQWQREMQQRRADWEARGLERAAEAKERREGEILGYEAQAQRDARLAQLDAQKRGEEFERERFMQGERDVRMADIQRERDILQHGQELERTGYQQTWQAAMQAAEDQARAGREELAFGRERVLLGDQTAAKAAMAGLEHKYDLDMLGAEYRERLDLQSMMETGQSLQAEVDDILTTMGQEEQYLSPAGRKAWNDLLGDLNAIRRTPLRPAAKQQALATWLDRYREARVGQQIIRPPTYEQVWGEKVKEPVPGMGMMQWTSRGGVDRFEALPADPIKLEEIRAGKAEAKATLTAQQRAAADAKKLADARWAAIDKKADEIQDESARKNDEGVVTISREDAVAEAIKRHDVLQKAREAEERATKPVQLPADLTPGAAHRALAEMVRRFDLAQPAAQRKPVWEQMPQEAKDLFLELQGFLVKSGSDPHEAERQVAAEQAAAREQALGATPVTTGERLERALRAREVYAPQQTPEQRTQYLSQTPAALLEAGRRLLQLDPQQNMALQREHEQGRAAPATEGKRPSDYWIPYHGAEPELIDKPPIVKEPPLAPEVLAAEKVVNEIISRYPDYRKRPAAEELRLQQAVTVLRQAGIE